MYYWLQSGLAGWFYGVRMLGRCVCCCCRRRRVKSTEEGERELHDDSESNPEEVDPCQAVLVSYKVMKDGTFVYLPLAPNGCRDAQEKRITPMRRDAEKSAPSLKPDAKGRYYARCCTPHADKYQTFVCGTHVFKGGLSRGDRRVRPRGGAVREAC